MSATIQKAVQDIAWNAALDAARQALEDRRAILVKYRRESCVGDGPSKQHASEIATTRIHQIEADQVTINGLYREVE